MKLIAEIISTPGPRKNHDLELGEDSGAILFTPRYVLFTVADGTSETFSVMGFSTRRLALELNQLFFEVMEGFDDERIVRDVESGKDVVAHSLATAYSQLMRWWSKDLSRYVQDNKDALKGAFAMDECIASQLGRRYLDKRDFSTTIVCGILTMNGTLQVAGVGDTGIIMHTPDGLSKMDMGKNRVYVRLRRAFSRYRFVKMRISESIVSGTFTGVDFLVSGSDGVGWLVDFVETQLDHFTLSEIRRSICMRNPNTSDDKTLCVVELTK